MKRSCLPPPLAQFIAFTTAGPYLSVPLLCRGPSWLSSRR